LREEKREGKSNKIEAISIKTIKTKVMTPKIVGDFKENRY